MRGAVGALFELHFVQQKISPITINGRTFTHFPGVGDLFKDYFEFYFAQGLIDQGFKLIPGESPSSDRNIRAMVDYISSNEQVLRPMQSLLTDNLRSPLKGCSQLNAKMLFLQMLGSI